MSGESSRGRTNMKKTIAIGCALILAASACGTPAGDGGDENASVSPETTMQSADADAPASAQSGASSATTTTTSSTSTTPAKAPTTTRASSGSAGASGSSTSEGGEDGIEVEGGGDDAVTGQVPTHLMDQVFAHAQDHTGVAASAMTVLRAESVTWPDGSLGCPEPGMSYTQALVPGYWVELSVDDAVLDYRLSERGGIKLCESGGSVPSARDDS